MSKQNVSVLPIVDADMFKKSLRKRWRHEYWRIRGQLNVLTINVT